MVVGFLNHGGMPDKFNHTHMLLIPKVEKSREMNDLRPISVCNLSYTLISKTLANRNKLFLHNIIYDNQSAFVLRRLITDNILLASKIFHFIKVIQLIKLSSWLLSLIYAKCMTESSGTTWRAL